MMQKIQPTADQIKFKQELNSVFNDYSKKLNIDQMISIFGFLYGEIIGQSGKLENELVGQFAANFQAGKRHVADRTKK